MSASATQATPQHDPGSTATDTYGHDEALNDLIGMGTDIARRLHGHAMAQPQPADQAGGPAYQANGAPPVPAPAPTPLPAPDALIRIAAAFDQIARAVRRCIALAQTLDDPKHPNREPAQDRTTARRRILRAVEDAIQRPPDNPECDDPEVLLSDFRERMDAADLEDDIASRPAEDIIKDILRDLGLAALPGSRPWKRRTSADIAELNARAAAPSSPARSTDSQPGAEPQDGHPASAQHSPDPGPDQRESGQREPSHSAAPARSPVLPGHTLPEDPAEAVAFVLRQAARTDAQWRPPPGG